MKILDTKATGTENRQESSQAIRRRQRKTSLSNSWTNTWPALLFLLILVFAWEYGVRLFKVDPLFLPSISSIVRSTIKNFSGTKIWYHWWTTIRTFGVGYLLGVPTGIVIASLLSQSKLAAKAFTPLVVMLVTLPTMVVIPTYMVWVGYNVGYRSIIVFLQVTSILTLNTLTGFENIDANKLALAKTYGANRAQTFFKVIFPNALPEVIQGMRLGVTFSITTTIGIELVAGTPGLGYVVSFQSGMLETSLAWGCILLIGLTGRILFMLVQVLERRLLTWKR